MVPLLLLYLSDLIGCTNWLKKWIALILTFIREERNQFMNFMLPVKISEFETNYRQKVTPETIENIVIYIIRNLFDITNRKDS